MVKKISILVTSFFLITSVFFTSTYFNIFKVFSQNIISLSLGINEVNYKTVNGNLIRGFSFSDLKLDSKNYLFKSKKLDVGINLVDLFTGFSNINFISSSEAELIMLNTFQESSNQSIREVKFNNLMIFYEGYALNLENINFSCIDIGCEYTFEIKDFKTEEINFNKIYLSGKINEDNKISSKFEVFNLEILNNYFSDFSGELEYSNNSLSLIFPIDKDKSDKSSIIGDINIKDKNLNINKLIVKIEDREPLILEEQKMFMDYDELNGKDIYIKYQNGSVSIYKFNFKNFENYSFDMMFDKFDINLFRGLNANGYLSGDLYINNDGNNSSASFSNAKIENFSYQDYLFDSIDVEGSFNNNELDLSDLKVSKQIGLLNVSGSFSSLENFYDKIIHKLKLKIKL